MNGWSEGTVLCWRVSSVNVFGRRDGKEDGSGGNAPVVFVDRDEGQLLEVLKSFKMAFGLVGVSHMKPLHGEMLESLRQHRQVETAIRDAAMEWYIDQTLKQPQM
jgi:hypothetical protein